MLLDRHELCATQSCFTISKHISDGLSVVQCLGPAIKAVFSLRWRHNEHDGVSNHQHHGCLLNRLFRRRSKKTTKLRVTGLCVGNSPGPVNSPHKGPVTRKMFPFDDVIMRTKGQLRGKCFHLMTSSCGTVSVAWNGRAGLAVDDVASLRTFWDRFLH